MKAYSLTFICFCFLSNIYSQIGWTKIGDYPGKAKSGSVGFSIGNNFYTGTGQFDRYYSNDFWKWNSTTNTWTQIAYVPGPPRAFAFAFSIGNKGYVGGGASDQEILNDFWEYDPDVNSWIQKTNLGSGLGYAAAAFSIGSKGYVVSGNALLEYDPLADEWTEKANFPGIGRSWAEGFSIGNKGYIVGGQTIWDSFSDFWMWDQLTDSWTQKQDYGLGPDAGMSSFTIGNKAYVGNEDFWEWDETRDSWVQVETLSDVNRVSAVGVSINGKGYIFSGGFYAGWPYFQKELWEYQPCTALQATSQTICIGNSTTLSAVGATSYTWNTGPTSSSIVVSPTVNTIYTVSAFGINNCIKVKTVTVTVNSPPYVNVTISNSVICTGQKVSLMASGAINYTWSTGSHSPTIIEWPDTTTTYVVWGENPGCILNSKINTIIVHASPTLNINGYSHTLDYGNSATLTANGAIAYSWSTGEQTPVIIVTPSANTIYTVVGNNLNGCNDTAFAYVNVLGPSTGLKANATEINDIKIYPNPNKGMFSISCNENAKISIFNSLGEEIYKGEISSEITTINIGDKPRGIYNIKILRNGNTYYSRIVME